MNILKVITPDNLGKGITFNPQTKQWEVQSGFDCAAHCLQNLGRKALLCSLSKMESASN